MRLDKFLSVTGTLSRSDAKRAIRAGRVSVGGIAARSGELQLDPEKERVCLDGREIIYRRATYIMLNKPEGYVSATDDPRDKTVLELLPDELRRLNLFPCGRLDKYTLGLMLITDDGELSHRLLAPKSHVSKNYRFRAEKPVSESDRLLLESGVHIEGGYLTKPAKVALDESSSGGIITICEGKYHQIKQMLEAVSNKITYLERVSFGPLKLDTTLSRGEWRFLTEAEIESLRNAAR
jgi:16S rRNA pseudouridine516 synthase